MSTVLPGFLTVKEAVKALGISEQRVRQLISGKQLKNCRRVGAALIIPESEVARRKEAFPPRRKQRLSPVPVTNGNGHK
jgi:hypothetical protein